MGYRRSIYINDRIYNDEDINRDEHLKNIVDMLLDLDINFLDKVEYLKQHYDYDNLIICEDGDIEIYHKK